MTSENRYLKLAEKVRESSATSAQKSRSGHSSHSSHEGKYANIRTRDLFGQTPVLHTLDGDEEDDDSSKRSSRNIQTDTATTLRAILPTIINEQNRKTRGTWQRQFDFTRTILGYVVGLHNFFRFPFLCYKFGVLFFVVYIIAMLIIGVPILFLEFTIGQYYGVSSSVAFTHMSPILGGVSKLITVSCLLNGWIYTIMTAWIRLYSGDVNSCIKGWEVCVQEHYYNTPNCYTGSLDDQCNDISMAHHVGLNINFILENEMLYYNFKCRTVDYFCKSHGWTAVPGKKECIDEKGQRQNIYSRRYHAADEFF